MKQKTTHAPQNKNWLFQKKLLGQNHFLFCTTLARRRAQHKGTLYTLTLTVCITKKLCVTTKTLEIKMWDIFENVGILLYHLAIFQTFSHYQRISTKIGHTNFLFQGFFVCHLNLFVPSLTRPPPCSARAHIARIPLSAARTWCSPPCSSCPWPLGRSRRA